MGKVKAGKLPCPFEDCGSSDAYHEFEDGGNWCFSCNRGSWERKKPEDLKKCFKEFRKVPKNIQEKLGFYSYVDDDGTTLYREYTYPGAVSKFREVIPKKFWFSGGRSPKLGGTWLYNSGSSNTVCIVEGEEDAAAFMTMCELPVVWLTSASIGTDRKEIYDYLNPFKKIILAFEGDEAGTRAKSIIGTMFPGKVYEASLTKFKDASDYLQNGCEKEFFWAVVNAKLFTADFVFNTIADFEKILSNEKEQAYVETPFQNLNKLIKGLPLSTVVLLTGQEGLGKTEILRAMEYHTLKNYPDLPISITHHEETKQTTLRGLACYELNKNCRNMDNLVPKDEVLSAIASISNNNLYLTDISQDELSLNSILDKFRYLVRVCGVKYFFVDPINQFASGEAGESVTRFLDSLALAMGKFVVDNNVSCVWTAHVNDEGKTRDSRMISKQAYIRVDITRDHMNADEEIRNTTHLSVSKNRFASKTGLAGQLIFDSDTFTVSERTLPF